ncbi:MAG: hypothetical protein KKF89_02120, partial [Nanoarchaeota archaeon]|nr:hypothetical protein [Nanoarchaeota archaeon]
MSRNKMKTKYVFEKLFVRDTTLIVQQAGANAHHKGLFDIINIKNPFKYMTAHYLNDDVIEVWKVVKSLQWLKKKISECNLKTEKIKEVLKEQKILEKKFKEMLRKKPTLEEFKESLKIIFKLVTNSFFINYTALDNNLKGEKKELALKAREKDTIIDDTDKYIRKSITYMFPHLKGCENALL